MGRARRVSRVRISPIQTGPFKYGTTSNDTQRHEAVGLLNGYWYPKHIVLHPIPSASFAPTLARQPREVQPRLSAAFGRLLFRRAQDKGGCSQRLQRLIEVGQHRGAGEEAHYLHHLVADVKNVMGHHRWDQDQAS